MTLPIAILIGVVLLVVLIAVADRLQCAHTIKRTFPIIGRFRYWFVAIGGPLRQYIVTANDEERPFSRDERRWVYASAKKENNYLGFGAERRKLKRSAGSSNACAQMTGPWSGGQTLVSWRSWWV